MLIYRCSRLNDSGWYDQKNHHPVDPTMSPLFTLIFKTPFGAILVAAMAGAGQCISHVVDAIQAICRL